MAAALLGTAMITQAQVSQEQMKLLFAPTLSKPDFEQAVADGIKAGVPAQMIAEAKLIWGLRHQDNAFLEKSLPELELAAKDFKKEESAALGSHEDFQALIHYIKALVAMKRNDDGEFKKNITEAFWLSPEQAQLFSQTVTNQRTQKKMASLKLDMKTALTTSKGETTTLEAQLGRNKAVLLDFWASWCGPCMALMPELNKRAAYLGSHGIVVCGMNTEGEEDIAEKVRKEKEMNLPWLVEPKDRPFSEVLEIATLPRVVLISPEGKILFNGHPKDGGLWTALQALDGTIETMKEE